MDSTPRTEVYRSGTSTMPAAKHTYTRSGYNARDVNATLGHSLLSHPSAHLPPPFLPSTYM